ncbi:hypothetical protein FRZ67_13015 [Panacibacter ginsenosidivorans]|uniref:PDZ domain-containing protein n=1 Tax=Panacibacter ginsenosidivorans TaxID=1813871 RepID=A0A5B8VAM5_9BACT|nr:S41 family peptidase [Panacibacter ginsenosidivorans]QEC68175.1 hypothetical protein FRZ67_13015 [Panacibacter ginsenosidivorans]
MRVLFVIVLLLDSLLSFAQTQPLNQATSDAYIITRMAAKFHVQPRLVDDDFSQDMFTSILKNLDEERIYFTLEDMNKLNAFRSSLDEQVKQRKNDFLQTLLSLYQSRMAQADTMIDNICKQPFNFSTAEKFTVEEDTSYPANATAMHSKMYKSIKRAVLESMAEDVIDAEDSSHTLSKKELDALEIKYRKRTQHLYKRSIKMKMEYPGGLPQVLGEVYCSAVATCYDPHTEYLPLAEKENLEAQLGNNIFRFGFGMDDDEENGGVVINSLKPGSPAFKSGLLNKGDKIMALQWEGKDRIDVSDASRQEVGDILSASNHDKIVFTVKKADGAVRELTLQKEGIDPDDEDNRVKSFLLKGSKTIGYISLPAFYSDWDNDDNNVHGCANDVATEIIKLQKENIEGLILDLRYNGGGSMREAMELAGIFIDAGPVEQIKDKEGKVYTLKDANRGTIYSGPLLLMVNSYSASASEMVAGTLQDYNRALIAGTPTYGKATSQVILPLDTTVSLSGSPSNMKPTSAFLKVTIEQLFRVNGTTAQKKGVEPDILIPDILDMSSERELNEPLALNVNKIDPNKFYRPYPETDYAEAKSLATKEIASDDYFITLKQYIETNKLLQQPKDMNLKWEDAISNYKKEDATIPILTKRINGWKPGFTVENNQFENERLKADSSLKELNDEIKEYLASDHALDIAYKVLLVQIK